MIIPICSELGGVLGLRRGFRVGENIIFPGKDER